MSKTEQLKTAQKELIENFITDPAKIKAVMSQYKKLDEKLKKAKFRKYTLRNFIFANEQLYQRTGNLCDILAPYKRWNNIDRNVRKGEKALWILAPMNKKIGEDEAGEPIYKTWFKRVPVFDLSQTDGDKLTLDFASGESLIKWETIQSKYDIILTNDTFRQGKTDGEKLYVSSKYNDNEKICIALHELAHMKLHFDDGEKLHTALEELEAETVSFMVASCIGIVNETAGAYITQYYKNNPADEIKNRSGRLIKCAENILTELEAI